MSVYKERSGNQCYDFWHKGQRYKESTHQKDRRQAQLMEAACKADLMRGVRKLKQEETKPDAEGFREFVESIFLPWFKDTHQDHPRSHRRHLTSSKPLIRFFSNVVMKEINAGMVEEYKARRASSVSSKTGQHFKPATVNRELAAMRAIFNLAIKRKVTNENPVKGVKFLPEDNEQNRVLSHEEVEAYLAVADPRLQEVAKLILNTGVRPGEAYRLRREDVHILEGYLHIPFGKTKAAKRDIPLSCEAKKLLAARFEKLGTEVYVFPSKRNPKRPMGNIANTHHRTVKRAGLEWFRLYDLRHTFATRAVQSNMDLPTLAKLLGHSKLNMVLRYAHPTPEHTRQAITRLERYVTENRPQSHETTTTQNAWVN
ncbi:MAG TPA: tyrosine-type recombinase/integrase [Terriglobia bacterium]|nr:tyrosine-type recombinase/integrase [Terriglobia bacterium]